MIIILVNLNKGLWAIATFFLILSGLFFTKKLKFIQFNIIEMFEGFKKKSNEKVTPFETLMLTLSGRIGVGSLAGVALSIFIGGPGTIFWMWIATIIVIPNAYVESYLGVLYHEKENDIYSGGPSYYILKGLNNKLLSKIYAILVIVTYIFGFLTIQANTISVSLEKFFGINPLIIGIVIAIVTAYVIIGGTRSIINVSCKIMPFISISYIIISVYIIANNFEILPSVFREIFIDAFKLKSFGAGFLGTFIIGFQRGIFSNEAGVGSGAISASVVDSDDAKGQGFIQMLGVYFTTLILCTLTAIIIMTSNYGNISYFNVNGIEIVQDALNFHLGSFGEIVLMITIFIFAFSTIISGYYYGESSLRFLNKNIKKRDVFLFQLLTIILLILGSIINSMFLWTIVDIFVAIMAIINVLSIIKLRGKVK